MRPEPRQLLSRLQRGAAAVEFSLIAVVFFFIWLGIMELGRMLYVWDTAQEVTRRAARQAVVRDFRDVTCAAGTSQSGGDCADYPATPGQSQRDAVFHTGSTGTVFVPAGSEISNARVDITYLQADAATLVSPVPDDPGDNISACNDATRTASCIRFVRARICIGADSECNFVAYVPMVSLFGNQGVNLGVNIPVSSVVMPAESLGFAPEG